MSAMFCYVELPEGTYIIIHLLYSLHSNLPHYLARLYPSIVHHDILGRSHKMSQWPRKGTCQQDQICRTMLQDTDICVKVIRYIYIYIYIYIYNYRRKFRSETSDTMDTWKSTARPSIIHRNQPLLYVSYLETSTTALCGTYWYIYIYTYI